VTTADDRAAREARFHDEAFSDQRRSGLWSSWYLIVRSSQAFYERYLSEHCDGAEALEYGCGLHSRAFLLAERGATDVIGIDISPVAVREGQERARREGLEGLHFEVMNAEHLEFDDNSFDLVFGTSVIHHLDLDRAYSEIARVLRPGGSAIFVEPLGHNAAINLYRRRTPNLRTPDEHPLLMRDIEAAGHHFGRVRARFFHLTSLLAVPLRRTAAFHPALSSLDRFDRALFRALPITRRYAWQVALELSRP
jgi:SAM-dependent methyltransferase